MVKQHSVAPFAITSQTQHFRPNNETYAGDLFVTSSQSGGPRIIYFYFMLFIFHQTRLPSSGLCHDRCSLLNQPHALLCRRSQQQAFNEPGPCPSFHRSKASLASRFSSSAFTAARPAAAQLCSRTSSFYFQMLA